MVENIEIIKFNYKKRDLGYGTDIHYRIKNDEITYARGKDITYFAALDETYSKLLRAVLVYEINEKYYDDYVKYDYDDSVKEKYEKNKEQANNLLKQFLIEKLNLSLL